MDVFYKHRNRQISDKTHVYHHPCFVIVYFQNVQIPRKFLRHLVGSELLIPLFSLILTHFLKHNFILRISASKFIYSL